MARILNLEAYPLATTISDNSYLVGTDVTDNKETKNFKIEDLKTHILPDALDPGTFVNATVIVDADGQISSVVTGSSSGISISTDGTSGPASLLNNILNIPVYSTGVALVGTYTDGYIPRWSATANTLESGSIRDNGSNIAVGAAVNSERIVNIDNQLATGDDQYGIYINTNSVGGTNGELFGQKISVNSTGGSNDIYGLEIELQANNGSPEKVKGIVIDQKTNSFASGTISSTIKGIELSLGANTGYTVNGDIRAIDIEEIDKGATISGSTYGIYQQGAGDKNYLAGQLRLGHTAGTLGQFLKAVDAAGNAEWADITSSELPSNIALVGTYTDSYVPRWNATTNTLESGKIRDDGDTVSIGGNPSSSNTFFTTTNTLTTAIQGQIKNDRSSQTHAIRARNENGGASNNVFATAFLAESTPTSSTPSGGIYVAGRFIQGNFSEFGSTGTIDLTSIQTEVDTNVNSDNVYAIKVDKVDINNSVSGNVYGLYLESHTGFGIVSGSKYGIYQNGSDKNYLAGQLQLNHTAGTEGQFLKSADTAGNAEWSTISASDVTGAVTATTGAAQRVAVFDGTDSIEGDANLTWDGSQIDVTDAQGNLAEMRADWLRVYNETDDANLFLYGYGSAHRGEIVLGAANGTRGGELPINNGNTTATISSWGHNGTSFKNNAQLIFQATEDYTSTVNGTRYILQTTLNGTNTLSTRYATDGNGDHTFTGNVLVGGQAYSSIQPTTVAATSSTIDWNDGNVAVLELGVQQLLLV